MHTQERFRQGLDAELGKLKSVAITEEDQELMKGGVRFVTCHISSIHSHPSHVVAPPLTIDGSHHLPYSAAGAITEVIGRQQRGRAMWYEVRKNGRVSSDTQFYPQVRNRPGT